MTDGDGSVAKMSSEVVDLALRILEDTLPALVLDPDFQYSIDTPQSYLASSYRFGGTYHVVRVPIRTNCRAKLLACTGELERGGLHRSYLAGLIDGAITAAFGADVAQLHSFWLDIASMDPSKDTTSSRSVALSEALAAGILTEESPLIPILRAHGCSTLVIDGSSIPGPNPDMVVAVESLVRKLTPSSVCDMFACTGVLGKLCARAGSSVDYVDLFCAAIRSNTSDIPPERVAIFEMDAFRFTPSHSYDLLILDPYYDLGIRVATEIIPTMKHSTRSIVFNIGIRADTYWAELVADQLTKTLGPVSVVELGESSIAIWP